MPWRSGFFDRAERIDAAAVAEWLAFDDPWSEIERAANRIAFQRSDGTVLGVAVVSDDAPDLEYARATALASAGALASFATREAGSRLGNGWQRVV